MARSWHPAHTWQPPARRPGAAGPALCRSWLRKMTVQLHLDALPAILRSAWLISRACAPTAPGQAQVCQRGSSHRRRHHPQPCTRFLRPTSVCALPRHSTSALAEGLCSAGGQAPWRAILRQAQHCTGVECTQPSTYAQAEHCRARNCVYSNCMIEYMSASSPMHVRVTRTQRKTSLIGQWTAQQQHPRAP